MTNSEIMNQRAYEVLNDDSFEQTLINISKAGAYDIVSKHNVELQEENKRLKDRIKFLEDLITETIEDLKKPLQ